MDVRHVEVFREKGRFAGWPANYGIWAWGDEIVVGFTVGYTDPEGGFHARDKTRPFVNRQARSLDGGETWDVIPIPGKTPGGRGLSADEHMNEGLWVSEVLEGADGPLDCPGQVDFTHPDFALMCAKTGLRPGVRSFWYYSTDRCRSWQGPFWLPTWGLTGIAARTDYLVDSAPVSTLFLTANKRDGREGRVFCARSCDGGRKFGFLSWLSAEPEGFQIMPASLRLDEKRILVAVRCSGKGDFEETKHWVDTYLSRDNGLTWTQVGQPVPASGTGGNPPTLTRLADGRTVLVYGYRAAPFGIRAKISPDDGASWGAEIVLRDDGGNPDIGYPRTVCRADGAVVIAYYYNDSAEGDRYIGATIWKP
ncbi:MAG: sialidase family protein [bacterium]|nr:sialidase family protein [bacterium]